MTAPLPAAARPGTEPAGLGVVAEHVGVRIGALEILRDVSVSFPPAAVTVLSGPSGSGKTTLLTALAGLTPTTSGTIRFRTPDGAEPARAQVRIGVVHQSFGLLSLLSAAENVELAAQVERRPRREVLADAAGWLEQVGLGTRGRHLVDELSGGEQQRVALARALMVRPQVLLADEPTAQLDAASRAVVLALLRRAADGGMTVVVATHDPDVAAWGDHRIALVSGELERGGRHRHPAATTPGP